MSSLLLALVLITAPGAADPAARRMVTYARELVGVPYDLGGRLRDGRGIDCQGVLFYAAERVGRCGWRSFSVYPTKSVARGELGRPVDGLAPVATAAVDIDALVPGDVLLLVGFDRNPAEGPIGRLAGRDVWVWHTGLYSGDGRWIVGDHYAGQVVETDLITYLDAHADAYAGIFVTRLEPRPAPRTCRRHRPMQQSKIAASSGGS